MGRWACALTSVVSLALTTRLAGAQDATAEAALAEALYRQGRALMNEGKVGEACSKFAESYRLDPATGALLNLASCHEAEGKLATAWLEFSRGASFARRDRRADRVRFAQERLAAIEPDLPHLTLVVPPANDVPGLELRVDGVPVRAAARGVSTPVDPGDHTLEAAAPGRRAWSQQVTVARAANVTFSVPTLDLLEPSSSAAASSNAPASPSAPIPTSAYIAGGITLVLAAAAGATAYVYMDHRARDGAEQREPELSRNRRLGAVNLALDAGALVGAGVTAYFYWTRPTAVAPWVGPSGAIGFGLQGSL